MNRKMQRIRAKSKKRRTLQAFTAGFLSLILVASIGVNSLAKETTIPAPSTVSASEEETINERLAAVTLLVKNRLGIGDDYTHFNGSLSDKSIRHLWTLNWTSDSKQLSITANSDGKIYSYSRYIDDYSNYYSNDFAPKFPSVTKEQSKVTAEAFLNKVLDENESCVLSDTQTYERVTDVDSYYFSGPLKINNLDTPININIRVSTSDLQVSSFSRSDRNTEFLANIPSAEPAITKEAAFDLLSGKVKMKLEYVPKAYNIDSKPVKAELRYLPISIDDYMVNAATGELINLTQLQNDIIRGINGGDELSKVMSSSDSAMGGAGNSLTIAELEGISKLEGVLERTELDSKARAITEFGLDDGYTINQINYYSNKNTDQITANLSYYKKAPQEEGAYVTYFYKYLTMDAKTGEFISLSSSYPGNEDYSNIDRDRDDLQQKAEAFLQKYFADHYKNADVYSENDMNPDSRSRQYRIMRNPSEAYTFAHKVNGYFFPSNALYISVNAKTGTIDSFSKSWTDNIEFDSADGIITNEAACMAYSNAFNTKLSYVSVPVKIDPSRPELIPYADLGYSFVYQLTLGYKSVNEDYVLGVNPKTGEVISSSSAPVQYYKYDDLSGHYAEKQIAKLAEHGIGYWGESFLPTKKLTQLEMVILFMSADGYRSQSYSENMSDDIIDQLYNAAYYRNVIKKDEKDPKKLMTRADVVRTILRMSGYNKTADLKDIYKCNFKDASSIKEADYGYFAIAQGLGIIRGDTKGNSNPYSTTTRVETAIMLYNFMSR